LSGASSFPKIANEGGFLGVVYRKNVQASLAADTGGGHANFFSNSLIFLLLCSLSICYIPRVLLPGAASAGRAASTKSWLNGETQNGLQPCGL
jgi:hypothetical protein